MVHEIATRKRTWEDARRISEESTVAYNLGRSAPYAERLLFEVPQEGTEDLDEGGISDAMLRQAGGKIKDVVTPRNRSNRSDYATRGQPFLMFDLCGASINVGVFYDGVAPIPPRAALRSMM